MFGPFDDDRSFYISEFDSDMERDIVMPLLSTIKKQAQLKSGEINLFINSYGGNADLAFHIVEMMEMAKRAGVLVRTLVTSAAYSAGSIVAVAGSPGERYIAQHANHLAHYGFVSTGENSTPLQAQRNAEATQVFFKQVLSHYERYCDIPNLRENLLADDWYIPSAQARKWKMADKLLSRYNIS